MKHPDWSEWDDPDLPRELLHLTQRALQKLLCSRAVLIGIACMLAYLASR
jgi:hypothetical protein